MQGAYVLLSDICPVGGLWPKEADRSYPEDEQVENLRDQRL